ncbi:hypothetical protein KAZ82_01880 [Candidatus Babeliales bacterium]|nr:hypothetical protein [Candidatus Babeliales bacterium]
MVEAQGRWDREHAIGAHREATNSHCRDKNGCSTTGNLALDHYRNETRNGGPEDD